MKNSEKEKKSFLYRNSLTLAFFSIFLVSMVGQGYTGWHEHNDFLQQYDKPATSFKEYLKTGHFIQATFENWESEFLQMALFVILTIFLRQEGSSESKKVGDTTIDNSELEVKPDAPWSVKKGGVVLSLYKNSLSIALSLIFIICFVLHLYGSWLDQNERKMLEGEQQEKFSEFIGSSKFWFESFQNWQSEFLSVFAIIFLSIFLRQIGSSQSKPVNDAHSTTGSE